MTAQIVARDNRDQHLRAAVVGVGSFGAHHARVLTRFDDVRLVGVADIDHNRASAVAAEVGSRAFHDHSELVGATDLVVVAVPTAMHAIVALDFLRAGVSVLIEKPIATTLEEADAMIVAAKQHGAILAAGHTEHFNPAISAARSSIRRPKFIEGTRLAPFTGRSVDLDVVSDLMIHDVDFAMSVGGGDIACLAATGCSVLTDSVDIANVRLTFSSGCVANLTASRVNRSKVRGLRIFQEGSCLFVDCLRQSLDIWTLPPTSGLQHRLVRGEKKVFPDEPLERELRDFVDAVSQRKMPSVGGPHAREVLAVVQRISATIRSQPASV